MFGRWRLVVNSNYKKENIEQILNIIRKEIWKTATDLCIMHFQRYYYLKYYIILASCQVNLMESTYTILQKEMEYYLLT